ncbi:hypothetical protein, partial [Streptomyces sp. NPDC001205]
LYIPQDRATVALMSDNGVVTPLPNDGRWRACIRAALADEQLMAAVPGTGRGRLPTSPAAMLGTLRAVPFASAE